jgi:hypothetical protein
MFGMTQPQTFRDLRDSAAKKSMVLSESGNVVPFRIFCPAFAMVLVLILVLGFMVLPAGADTPMMTTASAAAGQNIYVSGVTYDPAAFFTGDAGTVTYSVTNGNPNTSVVVNHASFSDNQIRLTSATYDTSSNIGPLQTRTYTFSVVADTGEGSCYPTFSLNIEGASSLYYRDVVKVDNTPLVMTIQNKPDAFTPGKKDTISIQIANPRNNDVKNVIFDVTGDNVALTPSKTYLGNLAAGTSTIVNFTTMPDQESTLSMTVTYDNGDNYHAINMTLPVQFSTDKTQANPVMSNIVATLTNGVYSVTGDVTNAGLLTANGVTVTSLSPAEPQDPDRAYVIGTLKQDDFGTYEVTFTVPAGTTNVQLQMSYKDKDGNVITSVQPVSLAGIQDTTDTNSQPGMLPAVVIILVILLGCGGYLYNRKRKNR